MVPEKIIGDRLLNIPLIPRRGSVMTPASRRSRCACEGTFPGTTMEPFSFFNVQLRSERLRTSAEAKVGSSPTAATDTVVVNRMQRN